MLINEKFKLGNILKITDLKLFLNKHVTTANGYKQISEIIPSNFKECKDCSISLFCWDCISVINTRKNDINFIKNRCIQNKNKLEKIIWAN